MYNSNDQLEFLGSGSGMSDAEILNAYAEDPRFTSAEQSVTPKLYADGMRTVNVTPDVLIYCHVCHDVAAPEYRLRRAGGKFIALCYKQGTGCWEQAPKPMCDHKDHMGAQCTLIAEWDIRYGHDMLDRSVRCLLHVAPALGDVGEHRIFAL